jgi:hypothetical protein
MSIIAKGKPLLEEMRALLRRQGYAWMNMPDFVFDTVYQGNNVLY